MRYFNAVIHSISKKEEVCNVYVQAPDADRARSYIAEFYETGLSREFGGDLNWEQFEISRDEFWEAKRLYESGAHDDDPYQIPEYFLYEEEEF